MSAKKSAEVIIDGKVYTLSGYEEEEYMQKVASYINNKINEFNQLESAKRLPNDSKSVLMQLNIADDYFKAKEQIEKYENDMELKDKEIYEIKHDLISNEIKVEELEKKVSELEEEKRELLLTKSRLEASLEDAMLGGLK